MRETATHETPVREAKGSQASVFLWELNDESSKGQPTWFEKCRPRSVRATPALILVEVEPLVDTWQEDGQDGFGQELRKLGRGVAQLAWASGLQRPVVLAIVEPEESRRKRLEKLAADQEWHRGEFTLWPVECATTRQDPPSQPELEDPRTSIEWLLTISVEALQYDTDSRPSRTDDRAPVADLVGRLRREQKPGLADLVEARFADIEELRPTESDAHPLTDDERKDVEPALERWIEQALATKTAEPKQAAQLQSQNDPGELGEPLLLTSYGAPPPRGLHFPADAPESARTGWAQEHRDALLGLRSQVLGRDLHELVVELSCTPAVAMYLGSIFHAATGIALVNHQHNERSGEQEIWRRTLGRPLDPLPLRAGSRTIGDKPGELQVRISVAQDVRPEADAWTAGRGLSTRVLELEVPALGREVIADGDQAYALAVAVRQAIVAEQRAWAGTRTQGSTGSARLPLRLFYAGPVTGALFIGAQLNAVGEVRLMDFLKDQRQYVESFCLSPGN